ncbi:MAG: rRNA maturation RNase YbeY [Thermodesulfovibrionia bacterium]|nr:rRNA maturation RNase YbeY [Thermodesulfovibrionia bacterium]
MKILIKNQQRCRKLDRKKIASTAGNILTLLKQPDAELSILFVGNKRMQELNTAFRGIRKTTDVLSFEAGLQLPGLPDNVLGDVVINIYRAESQAEAADMGLYDEIYRLLIHGILHLLGYEHENGGSDEKKMVRKERAVQTALENI